MIICPNPKIVNLIFVAVLSLSGVAFASTQKLTMSEDSHLEAQIASDVMNRLAVVNDRIKFVFGDEESFVTEKDEEQGQIYIKPTPENGNKPLPITLTTENGLTQDLILIPNLPSKATVILRPSKGAIASRFQQENLNLNFSPKTQTTQEAWIQILKQAVLGELTAASKGKVSSRKVEGFQIKHEASFQAGPLQVQVWSIKNSGNLLKELLERDFYQNGDIALSLQKRILEPNEKTLLYVLENA